MKLLPSTGGATKGEGKGVVLPTMLTLPYVPIIVNVTEAADSGIPNNKTPNKVNDVGRGKRVATFRSIEKTVLIREAQFASRRVR